MDVSRWRNFAICLHLFIVLLLPSISLADITANERGPLGIENHGTGSSQVLAIGIAIGVLIGAIGYISVLSLLKSNYGNIYLILFFTTALISMLANYYCSGDSRQQCYDYFNNHGSTQLTCLTFIFYTFFARSYFDIAKSSYIWNQILWFQSVVWWLFMMENLLQLNLPVLVLLYSAMISAFLIFSLGIYLFSFHNERKGAIFSIAAIIFFGCQISLHPFFEGPLASNIYLITLSLQAVGFIFVLNSRAETIDNHQFERVIQQSVDNSAQEIKNTFMTKLSHDIRTPLSGVLGMIELLQDTKTDEQQQNYLGALQNSGNALLNIINDITDYSQIDTEELRLNINNIQLESVLEQTQQLFKFHVTNTNIRLNTQLSTDIPLNLRGDTKRLQQILTNFVNNAFIHTEAGEINIAVSLVEEALESAIVEFIIKDTSGGKSTTFLEELFCTHDKDSNTRPDKDTEIGLIISQHLIQLMGGNLKVIQDNGDSSIIFSIKFERFSSSQSTDIKYPKSTLEGKRLLVVDDHQSFCNLIFEQASRWGMTVDVAKNAHSALERLRTQSTDAPYDLITLDLNLPEIDGIELSAMIDIDETIPQIPKVLLTGTVLPPSADDLSQVGIIDIVVKPASSTLLFNTFTKIISETSSAVQPKLRAISDLNILIAEDNPMNQQVIEGLLHRSQVTNTCMCHNGLEVVNLYKNDSHRYDLILMDCEMPRMDGYEATEDIRQYEQAQNISPIPIIALSAHAEAQHVNRSLAVGMQDHLTKPINPSALILLLKKWGQSRQYLN
jgi:CheY-like chemotaxis protein/signal transduction histidine kinase